MDEIILIDIYIRINLIFFDPQLLIFDQES